MNGDKKPDNRLRKQTAEAAVNFVSKMKSKPQPSPRLSEDKIDKSKTINARIGYPFGKK